MSSRATRILLVIMLFLGVGIGYLIGHVHNAKIYVVDVLPSQIPGSIDNRSPVSEPKAQPAPQSSQPEQQGNRARYWPI